MEVVPIGFVRGGRPSLEQDHWGSSLCRIELDPGRFSADALLGLDEFSHAEVIFHFDRVPPDAVCHGAKHPRNDPAWPRVGIFAQRAPQRPNRLGVTICGIEGVEGLSLFIRGLDAADGSPVLDIKPVWRAFQPRGAIRQPDWVSKMTRDYW